MSQNRTLNSTNSISYTYNPENQTRDELIDNFVIRTKEFTRIYRDISETDLTDSPQHYLLEGKRGTGKTSMMLRLRYEIEAQQKVENNNLSYLLPVQLREEQYGIYTLAGLWEHVADHLYETEGFEELSDELHDYSRQKNYPTICFSILDNYLIKNQKRVILFLDNFGDLLDKFTDIELKRLRDIFHTSKHIQLIAASARTLEYTYKHDQPFYEFFNIVRLKNLDNKQATTLLQQLAVRHDAIDEIETIKAKQPERIETIRILTGGVPRTIVLLFEIFLDQNGNVFEDLESLLDRVTPLYKHRMDDLKPKQQAIVDVIALNWDGISTADIVKHLNDDDFDSKKVAAQLKALEKNDLIESKKMDKKNNIYFIKERFFNIWYLMRLSGRKDKNRVKCLVSFLEAWYSQDSLRERINEHIDLAKEGQLNEKSAFYLTQAMADITTNLIQQYILLHTAKSYLEKIKSGLSEEISSPHRDQFLRAYELSQNGEYTEAINTLESIPESYNGYKESILATFYSLSRDYKTSKSLLKYAIKQKEVSSYIPLTLMYLIIDKNFNKANSVIRLYLEEQEQHLKNEISTFKNTLISFMTLKQYQLTFLFFQDFPHLKNTLKPLYFALMTLLKDEYPKEYLKMGKELEPTVNEILDIIKNNQKELENA